jgi:hypothetical protein
MVQKTAWLCEVLESTVSRCLRTLSQVTVKSLSTALALAAGLDAVVIVVVLAASAVAELFVLARLAACAAGTRRSVRNDAPTVFTAGQLTLGCYEPVELQVHRP